MILPFLFLVLLSILFIVYAEKIFNLFRSKDQPPLVYGYPVVGSAIEYAMDMKKFFEKYTKQHGDVFEMKVMGINWIVFQNYEDFKQIYKKSEDISVSLPDALMSMKFDVFLGKEGMNPFHATLIKNHLTPNRVQATPFIEEAGILMLQETIEKMMKNSDSTATLVKPFKWCVEVASKATLRSIAGSEFANDPKILSAFSDFITDIDSFLQFVVLIPYKLSECKKSRFDKHYEKLMGLIVPLVTKKREMLSKQSVTIQDDIMLQQLFNSHNHEGERFTDEGLAKLIVQTAWAGVVTTGDALISLLYDICNNPVAQQTIYDEMRRECGMKMQLSIENIEKLDYLESCIKESLRMTNLEVRCQRLVTSDITVGKYHIKKGSTVGMSVYKHHYDNNRFPNANQFVPDRFVHCKDSTKEPLLTFGLGKHACPGRYYSIHVVKTLMCAILRDYEIGFAGNGQRPPYTVVPIDVPVEFTRRAIRRRALSL